MKCMVCSNSIERAELLGCVVCKVNYHFRCLNMTTAHYMGNYHRMKHAWKCSACSNVTQRRHKSILDDSPSNTADMSCDDVQPNPPDSPTTHDTNNATTQSTAQHQELPAAATSSFCFSLDQFANLLDSKLDTKLERVRVNIAQEFRQEFEILIERLELDFRRVTETLAGELREVKEDVYALYDKVQSLEAANLSLQNELSTIKSQGVTSASTSLLEETVCQLQSQVNQSEQSTLLTDIELTGIPEFPGESVMHIVTAVSSKLSVSLTSQDVVSATRTGGRNRLRGEDGVSIATRTRPRPIVVRLLRQAHRDELIKSARVRRTLTTGDLGLPAHEPSPFYVNERLTKTNRVLFAKTREAARAAGWKFVWTKSGSIFTKRMDSYGSQTYRIRTETDIVRIFGLDKNSKSE